MDLVAGVDIGGTNIAVGLVDENHRVVEDAEVPTPTGGPREVVAAVVRAVEELAQRPAGIGVGAPGPVSGGVVHTAPNLRGFTEPVPLADLLREATGLPVLLGNDASLGTVGEWAAGAGRGSSHLLGVWVGTGIGGGLVLDGRPYDGAFGGAGEFGHLVVRQGGALCGCGRRGCVEAYAGRRCLERAVDVAVQSGRSTSLPRLMEAEGKDRITSRVWKRALREGDPLAVELIGEAVAALGAAVGSAANLLDVDRIVVGGGLAEKLGQDFADRIQEAARPWMLAHADDRRVVVAELGDHSGVVGAAYLAHRQLSA